MYEFTFDDQVMIDTTLRAPHTHCCISDPPVLVCESQKLAHSDRRIDLTHTSEQVLAGQCEFRQELILFLG